MVQCHYNPCKITNHRDILYCGIHEADGNEPLNRSLPACLRNSVQDAGINSVHSFPIHMEKAIRAIKYSNGMKPCFIFRTNVASCR